MDAAAAIAKMQAKMVALGKAPYAGLTLAAVKVAAVLRAKVTGRKRARAKRQRAVNAERKMLGASKKKFAKRKTSGVKIAVVAEAELVRVTASGVVQHLAEVKAEREEWLGIVGDEVTQSMQKALK